MTVTTTTAIKTANAAAKSAFDAYLVSTRSGATQSVPDFVVAAAQAAYAQAGGKGRIAVRGYGNRTHPVCGVEVIRNKAS